MTEHALIPLLIGKVQDESVPLCNARDLHAALKAGRVFAAWITGRIEEYGFVEGDDFFPVLEKTPKRPKGGRPSIDYRLTIDMAKELAMIENNDIGRSVRRYFIQAEKTLREKLLAELREKAEHVLPVPGVKPLRDGLKGKDSLKLHEQSRNLLRQIMREPSQVERQNLHYHYRQINLTLGIPTIDLAAIEAELAAGLPALEG